MKPLGDLPAAAVTDVCGAYVHVGCGFNAPHGWVNFDASPTLRFQRLPLIGRLARRLTGNSQDFPGAPELAMEAVRP